MWIELIEKKDIKKNPPIKIEPPPYDEYELRCIVWETKECVFKDELAECNDLFVRGGFEIIILFLRGCLLRFM